MCICVHGIFRFVFIIRLYVVRNRVLHGLPERDTLTKMPAHADPLILTLQDRHFNCKL